MADFQTIIYQIILSTLRSAEFTSASPGHINTFMGVQSGLGEIGTSEELRQAILSIIGEDFEGDNPDSLTKNLDKKKSLEKEVLGNVQKGMGIAQNPAILVAEGLKYLPHAALVAFAISLAPLVFEYLTKPGGDLDLRLKIYLHDEFNAFLSRQTQKDTEMGVRQVIIQSKKGFTAINGLNNYNTLKGIREGGIVKERIERIGMTDHAKGLW